MAYFVGLDLGKSADYTALAVVQTVKEPNQEGELEKYLHLRHLERYPLGVNYTTVADGVCTLLQSPPFTEDEYDLRRHRIAKPKVELLVDRAGVGEAVVDILKERGLKFTCITITGGMGQKANYLGGGTYSVPKIDLVAALEVPFHKGTLQVAEGLTLWPALREELLNFRRRQNTRTAHVSFEHWRESDHDDLVLVAALACWGATRRRGQRTLRLIR
jgi:hypothetical protein